MSVRRHLALIPACHLFFAIFVSAALGCSSEEDGDPMTDDNPPSTYEELASSMAISALVDRKEYTSWKAEPTPHASPIHDRVRVFFNPALEASLRAGNAAHPSGSIVVKELYDMSDALVGHAVGVKDKDNSTAEAWVWYESFLKDNEPAVYGRAHSACTGCHSQGKDFVISALPPT